MANFQTPQPVRIDQLDLGQIQNNNLRAQAMQLQNGQAQREENALAAYRDAIQQGASPDQAANAMRSMSPLMADKLSQNALVLRTNQAALANDMDKFIAHRVPMASDQAGWDNVLSEAQARYGIQIPPSLRTYSPQLQQALLQGGLTAAQRIAQQRQDTTAQALGLPAGVDPSTYAGAASTMQNAAQRAQMFPAQLQEAQGRADMIPLQQQNIQSEIDARKAQAAQPRVIMIPDPNDPLGMKKVPGYLDPETNSIVPFQTAPGDLGGQGPVPGQGGQSAGGTQGQFRSAPDVVSAFKAGKITRDQAAQILRSNGWAQ